MTTKPTSLRPGEVLGGGHADWPDDLHSYEERKAYQRGVADARALAQANPAELCEASLCMQANRCSYSPCRSGGNPEPTRPQQGPTDEQIAALAWRIGMGPAIVAGSDVVGFARAVLALKGGVL